MPQDRTVTFEGKPYTFPADTTDEEILAFLGSLDSTAVPTQADAAVPVQANPVEDKSVLPAPGILTKTGLGLQVADPLVRPVGVAAGHVLKTGSNVVRLLGGTLGATAGGRAGATVGSPFGGATLGAAAGSALGRYVVDPIHRAGDTLIEGFSRAPVQVTAEETVASIKDANKAQRTATRIRAERIPVPGTATTVQNSAKTIAEADKRAAEAAARIVTTGAIKSPVLRKAVSTVFGRILPGMGTLMTAVDLAHMVKDRLNDPNTVYGQNLFGQEGMPERQDYATRKEFRAALAGWIKTTNVPMLGAPLVPPSMFGLGRTAEPPVVTAPPPPVIRPTTPASPPVTPAAGFKALGKAGRSHFDDLVASQRMLEGMQAPPALPGRLVPPRVTPTPATYTPTTGAEVGPSVTLSPRARAVASQRPSLEAKETETAARLRVQKQASRKAPGPAARREALTKETLEQALAAREAARVARLAPGRLEGFPSPTPAGLGFPAQEGMVPLPSHLRAGSWDELLDLLRRR